MTSTLSWLDRALLPDTAYYVGYARVQPLDDCREGVTLVIVCVLHARILLSHAAIDGLVQVQDTDAVVQTVTDAIVAKPVEQRVGQYAGQRVSGFFNFEVNLLPFCCLYVVFSPFCSEKFVKYPAAIK